MLIEKDELPLVTMNFMNETHNEDREIINEIFELILHYEKNPSQNNTENINVSYQKWFNHTVEHFNVEEEKMRELNFPPYTFHKGEHDKALELMHEVFSEWKESENIFILKRYFIEDLPLWLTQHIQSMDMVTAEFFATGKSPCSG